MDRKPFFGAIRKTMFSGALSQDVVDDIDAILDAWETYGDGDDRKLAYVLATGYHESDRFRTMEEYASGAAYEGRANLGNTQKGDGKLYKGRGFVQLTGRINYEAWQKRTGLPLLARPMLVSQRPLAARILVQGSLLGSFTGRKLGNYITPSKADFVGARRVINGTDRADLIAGYAKKFLVAIQASASSAPAVEADAPVPASDQAATAPDNQPRAIAPALLESTKRRLRDLGYYAVGMVDDEHGPNTVAGLAKFQTVAGLPLSGQFDDATMAAIWANDAPRAPIAAERAGTTAADLLAKGNPIAVAAKRGKVATLAAGAAGVAGTLWSAVSSFFGDAWQQTGPVREAFDKVPGWLWGAMAVGIAVYLYRQHQRAEQAEVTAVQTGRQP